jgi:hypothetical protein
MNYQSKERPEAHKEALAAAHARFRRLLQDTIKVNQFHLKEELWSLVFKELKQKIEDSRCYDYQEYEILSICKAMNNAISNLSKRNIVHKDIKPSNILVKIHRTAPSQDPNSRTPSPQQRHPKSKQFATPNAAQHASQNLRKSFGINVKNRHSPSLPPGTRTKTKYFLYNFQKASLLEAEELLSYKDCVGTQNYLL